VSRGGFNASGQRVRIFNQNGLPRSANSREQTSARIRLKLYALAYVEARHGVDASPALLWDALVIYCEAAKAYVGALERTSKHHLIDHSLGDDRGAANGRTMGGAARDRVSAARTQLKIAALAYEANRRGADSTAYDGFGLALVCQAAITYVEALEGPGADKSHLMNDLQLED